LGTTGKFCGSVVAEFGWLGSIRLGFLGTGVNGSELDDGVRTALGVGLAAWAADFLEAGVLVAGSIRLGTCVGASNGTALNGGLTIAGAFEGGIGIGCLETESLPGLVSSVGSCAPAVVALVGVLGFDAGLVILTLPGVGLVVAAGG
jgi:hypothetical protein